MPGFSADEHTSIAALQGAGASEENTAEFTSRPVRGGPLTYEGAESPGGPTMGVLHPRSCSRGASRSLRRDTPPPEVFIFLLAVCYYWRKIAIGVRGLGIIFFLA